MKPNSPHTQSQYEKSGIYKLTYPDCQKKYIGQTDWSFHKRFQEHFNNFNYNKNKSKFATHLLEHQHSTGPINENMKVLYSYTTNKGRLMDTMEKFYVYNETLKNNQVNDKNTVKSNAIIDIISSHDPLQSAHWCATKHRSRQVSHPLQVHTNTPNTAQIKNVSTTGICSLNIS